MSDRAKWSTLEPLQASAAGAGAQVEREAQGLKRTTEALEGRTAALGEQLAAQRAQADQRLFAAQQETDQARAPARPRQAAGRVGWG